MSGLLDRLKTEVLIGPASLSTNLEKSGYSMTDFMPWWVFNHPREWQDMLRSFFNVGSDFTVACTMDCNKHALKSHGLEDKTGEINSRLLNISREVVPNNCYLACDISAMGQYLPPMGNISFDELYEGYAEQVVIAENIGVDFYWCMGTNLEELEALLKAIKDNSQLPVVALMYFNPTPKGFRTLTGVDPRKGAQKLEEFGADVIGTMCGGISYIETTAVLKEMRQACSKYLATRPNAGTPQLVNSKTIHPRTPEEMAEEAPNWVDAGAKIISACCGSTLEHIAKVASVLKK